jgi:polyribonucleotide nucleotidyltransferase
MATVCAGSLALMDAGVPLSTAVGGISIGLIKEGGKTALLTDILGMEDHFGDMDFKVTGTRDGVTALQLDLKIEGISVELLSQALYQAKDARMVILDKMKEALTEPRSSISTYAPRIVTLKINPDRIKDVIGPGGKIIKKITAETGVTIDIEDDGTVMVASVDSDAAQKAIEIIKGLTAEVEVGKIYPGKVKRLMNFGAFVEVMPGKEGLVHVSELSDKYVSKVEDVVKIGDEFMVKVIEIDSQGRVNLSRKQALRSENKDKETPKT